MGFPCDKYVKVMVPLWLPTMVEACDVDKPFATAEALAAVWVMSATTIDRYLQPVNRPGFNGDFDVPWVSRSWILRIPCVTVWFPRIVSRARRGCPSPTLSGVCGCETTRDTRISRWLTRGESAMLSCSEARCACGPKMIQSCCCRSKTQQRPLRAGALHLSRAV